MSQLPAPVLERASSDIVLPVPRSVPSVGSLTVHPSELTPLLMSLRTLPIPQIAWGLLPLGSAGVSDPHGILDGEAVGSRQVLGSSHVAVLWAAIAGTVRLTAHRAGRTPQRQGDELASIFHDGPVWGWSALVASRLF